MSLCAPYRVLPCGCVVSPDGLILYRIPDRCFVVTAKLLEKKVENKTYLDEEAAA